MQPIILPGSTVGVLGSGQLGRMFALKGRAMGYRIHTFSPDADSPTGQIADREWRAPYEDLDAVRRFAAEVDVITFEFENIPFETTACASEVVPVWPRGEILHTTQNRLREKTYLKNHGIPVPPFAPIHSLEELDNAVGQIGTPAILKTAGWGYDGKGQTRINSLADVRTAFAALNGQDGVLEAYIEFEHEASLIGARGQDGRFVHFGLFENIHQNHILDITVSPARLNPNIEKEAIAITREIFETLDVVGVLCVEFFVTASGSLLVNELAPRPHNSGHVTYDNCITSQFEQQLRAICGLPLGSTEMLCPGVMVNLLGDVWEQGEPDWAAACEFPGIKLHLYGKQEARPGRKMGHLTAIARDVHDALNNALAAREALRGVSVQGNRKSGGTVDIQ